MNAVTIFHLKKDSKHVGKLVKAWDDPRVSARLADEDPNNLEFAPDEWVFGAWTGPTPEDDKSFRELGRLVRSVARANARGAMLLWKPADVPDLAEQLGLATVEASGEPDEDVALLRETMERAGRPSPAAHTANWAFARGPAPVSAAPRLVNKDDELGVPFVQPPEPKRRSGALLWGVGLVALIGAGAAAGPWVMARVQPMLASSVQSAPAAAPSTAVLASTPRSESPLERAAPLPETEVATIAPADALAPVSDADMPKVERISPGAAGPLVIAPPEPAPEAKPKPPAPAKAVVDAKPAPAKPAAKPSSPVVASPAKPAAKPTSPVVASAAKPVVKPSTKPLILTLPAADAPPKPEGDFIATAPSARTTPDTPKPAAVTKPAAAKPAVKPAAKPKVTPPPPAPPKPQGPDL